MEHLPVYIINHAHNVKKTICRLPPELLLMIMRRLMDEDLAALYLVRQSCRCFAHLFASREFTRYHDTEYLPTTYLQPFCMRFIDVALSTHRQRICHLLERDMKPAIITGQMPEGSKTARGDEAKRPSRLKCHLCNTTHTDDCFPAGQKQATEDGRPVCGLWFGHFSICPHCPFRGEDIHNEPTEDVRDYRRTLWSCEECWAELVPTGQALEDIFPSAKRPTVVYQYIARPDDSERCWVDIEWTMPLFADMQLDDDREPSEDMFTIMERKLQEIARGLYRELLAPTCYPYVPFCSKEILEQLRTKYRGKLPGTVPYSLDFKVSAGTYFDDDIELALCTMDGNVYLEFHYTTCGWSQEIPPSEMNVDIG